MGVIFKGKIGVILHGMLCVPFLSLPGQLGLGHIHKDQMDKKRRQGTLLWLFLHPTSLCFIILKLSPVK